MPSDDFRGAEAGDALCAAVPAGDVSVRTDGDDGVVDDALDQQAETLLALAQVPFVFAALGEIPDDLREAHESTVEPRIAVSTAFAQKCDSSCGRASLVLEAALVVAVSSSVRIRSPCRGIEPGEMPPRASGAL